MLDFNIVAGFSVIIVSGIFLVWFFGKITNSANTQ